MEGDRPGDLRIPGGWDVFVDVGDMPALYWGTRDPSPLQTYEFWGPSPGGGEMAVVFTVGTVQWARAENVWTEGDQLRFEIWNDWGSTRQLDP